MQSENFKNKKSETRTMSEAGEILRISQPVLYKLINENKLKTYKIGRRRFTTVQALNECISNLENNK